MKILQIVASACDDDGGTVVGVKNLTRALQLNGQEVIMCAVQKGLKQPEVISRGNYRIYVFPAQRPYRYYFSPQLGAFLRQTIPKYDLAHIHGLWTYPTFIAARICRLNHIPYIMEICGMLDTWSISQKRLKKLIYFHCIEKYNLKMAGFIQFSTAVEFKKSFYKRLHSGQLRYIPMLFDLGNNHHLKIRPDQRLIDKRYILFFGRLCYKKGLDVLIAALSHLQSDPAYQDIYLVLMGSDQDNYLARLKRRMSDLKVWQRIINIGMVYGAQRFSIVKGALLMCLPSRQENLGLSIIETLACGIPVLVSDSVDIAGVIEREGMGRVSKIDVLKLSAAIKEMIDSDSQRQKMGQKAGVAIAQVFNNGLALEQYLGMYKEVLKKPPQLNNKI